MDLLKRELFYQNINEFYKNSLKKFLNYAMLERNNYRFYLLAGFCYKKMNNFEKAVIYFTKAFKRNSNCFEAFYECGLCALKMDDTCLAANCFVSAIKINPNHPYAILNLAYTHEMCGEPDMAELIYNRLIETNPQFIEGYIKKSELIISLERYSEVIEMLTDLIKNGVSDGRIFEILGNCYIKTGKKAHALRALRKAATLTENLTVYRNVKKNLKQISLQNKSPILKLC